MNIAITGAQGFVATQLIEKLKYRDDINRIYLIDLEFSSQPFHPKLTYLTGNLTDVDFLEQVFSQPLDYVFHLASIPGATAEKNPTLALQVNVIALTNIIDILARQPKKVCLINTSSVAVYGSCEKIVHENDMPHPLSVYATHKVIGELLVSDAIRRGQISGFSIRLPGIVARKNGLHGFSSAFMSQIFWHLKNKQSLTLPVSMEAKTWWLSAEQTAQNLCFAAFQLEKNNTQTVYQLPVLYASVEEVVRAISCYCHEDRSGLIKVEIDDYIQKNFGSFPALNTPYAEQQGFMHDGDLANLVKHVFEGYSGNTAITGTECSLNL